MLVDSGLHVLDDAVPGAPVAVLLHSLFFSGDMFDDVVAELDGAVRSVRPDHRGQGRSAAAGAPLTVDQLTDDVVALVERLDRPVHLVGSSMGAYVATRVAARRPQLVASCALLGCTAGPESRREHFQDLVDGLRAGGPAVMVDRIERTMFGDAYLSRPLTDPVRSRWRRHFRELPPTVADAAEAMFARPGMEDALAALQVPLLLVAGGQDRAKRPADMAAIADQVPGSRLVVLADAGHTPVVEAPRDVAFELRRWWCA